MVFQHSHLHSEDSWSDLSQVRFSKVRSVLSLKDSYVITPSWLYWPQVASSFSENKELSHQTSFSLSKESVSLFAWVSQTVYLMVWFIVLILWRCRLFHRFEFVGFDQCAPWTRRNGLSLPFQTVCFGWFRECLVLTLSTWALFLFMRTNASQNWYGTFSLAFSLLAFVFLA